MEQNVYGEVSAEETDEFRRRRIRRRSFHYVLLSIALLLGVLPLPKAAWHGNTELHTLLEAISCLLAFASGAIALVRHYAKKNSTFLLLGSCFLGTAILNGFHAVATASFLNAPGSIPPPLAAWSGEMPRVFMSSLLYATLRILKEETKRPLEGRIKESSVYLYVSVWAIVTLVLFVLVPLRPIYFANFIFPNPVPLASGFLFGRIVIEHLRAGLWKTDDFEHWFLLALIMALIDELAYRPFIVGLFDARFFAIHVFKILIDMLILTGLFISMYSIFKREAENASQLEVRVQERTEELSRANADLAGEIVERKNTEAMLLEAKEAAQIANRGKSEFLANMSHEIRTPLNGIVGMTDLALDTELSAEQKEYLETVKLSADSLLSVINDILDFSKIEAGKIDLEIIDFDLRDTLEGTLRTLSFRADEKGLELLCEVAPEVPEILRGDFNRLRQVVVNLVGNAIKFTSQGEVALKVYVEAEDGEDCVIHFVVSDTGIGIALEKQQSIFEPFTQADTSTTRKYGGTGLGLTISTRLVEVMKGKIWVASEVGRGTQFHFTARFGVTDDKAVEMGKITPPEVLRGVNALIVDDNLTNRRILLGMLGRWEMIPIAVDGAESALAQLVEAWEKGNPYRLILTDMHMPEVDGFTLIERIRQRPELAAATIMMLTSAGHRGDAARCRELGVGAYLMKPIRQSELHEAIALVLGGHEQGGAVPLITRYSLGDAREPSTILRILLAEDNAVNQRLATRLLEKRGHRVAVVANGREALEALEKENFDLVFMDVQMPEMSGFEATIALREKEKGTRIHLPVIALTAHAMKGDREHCLQAGMDGYLTKPICAPELDKILNSYSPRVGVAFIGN